MKILVTAFEPFDGEELNPSLEAVKNLDLEEAELIKLTIPTVFNQSIELVCQAIDQYKPQYVLAVGQAGGRFDVTPERIAINLDDARIADNAGNMPIDKRIVEKGKNAYFSTLPVKAMVMKIREGGLPASLSNSAGTFVCNHLMYGILHYIEEKKLNIRAGFIHVPYAPEQVVNKSQALPSMSLEDITRALRLALEAILENGEDLAEALGSIH